MAMASLRYVQWLFERSREFAFVVCTLGQTLINRFNSQEATSIVELCYGDKDPIGRVYFVTVLMVICRRCSMNMPTCLLMTMDSGMSTEIKDQKCL